MFSGYIVHGGHSADDPNFLAHQGFSQDWAPNPTGSEVFPRELKTGAWKEIHRLWVAVAGNMIWRPGQANLGRERNRGWREGNMIQGFCKTWL